MERDEAHEINDRCLAIGRGYDASVPCDDETLEGRFVSEICCWL
jgi:hypothetical protein